MQGGGGPQKKEVYGYKIAGGEITPSPPKKRKNKITHSSSCWENTEKRERRGKGGRRAKMSGSATFKH